MKKYAAAAVKHSAAVLCCIVGEAVTEEAAAVEHSAVVVCCMAGETVAFVWCTDWVVEDQ